MARETWTDERMDDLKGQVEKGFDGVEGRIREVKGEIREVKGEIREVKGEVREVKGEVREVRGEVRELRTETNARFDSMQRTMIIGFAGIFASTVGSVITAVLVA